MSVSSISDFSPRRVFATSALSVSRTRFTSAPNSDSRYSRGVRSEPSITSPSSSWRGDVVDVGLGAGLRVQRQGAPPPLGQLVHGAIGVVQEADEADAAGALA